jgi:hypothetical protein
MTGMKEDLYRPSWVDRFTAAIEKLPAPLWLVYTILAIPWVVVFIAVQSYEGAYEPGGFYAWHLFVAIQPIFGVMAIHYLDRVAAKALREFQPALKTEQVDFDSALYRLTTLPANKVWIASVIGPLFAVIQLLLVRDAETLSSFQHVAPTSLSLAFHNTNIVVAWIGYAVVFYHAYHQLRVIDWLYTSKAVIDPFFPEPLYALSEITSRTAILLLATIYGWFAVGTGGSLSTWPTEPLFYLTSALVLGLGLLVFIWPLWGAHQLLVRAKNFTLEKNASSYKTAVEELHRAVSARELDEIDVWHKALAALDLERRHLDRLATWPWSPSAFRNLAVTLVTPLLIWIVQYWLQRLME